MKNPTLTIKNELGTDTEVWIISPIDFWPILLNTNEEKTITLLENLEYTIKIHNKPDEHKRSYYPDAH